MTALEKILEAIVTRERDDWLYRTKPPLSTNRYILMTPEYLRECYQTDKWVATIRSSHGRILIRGYRVIVTSQIDEDFEVVA